MSVITEIRRKFEPPAFGLSRSLKIIGTDTNLSATYDFLLVIHSNRERISYSFPDKRRFRSKIANFSHPMYSVGVLGFL